MAIEVLQYLNTGSPEIMSQKDFWHDVYDFFGHGSFTTTAGDNAPLLIKDTSAAGTPTYALVDGAPTGELALDFDTQNEAQILTLYQNNVLQYDIDLITEVEYRLKLNQATFDAANILVFGVAGDQNDTADSVAQHVWFRLEGSTTIVVEYDDGTNTEDDVSTGGQVLGTSHVDFKISFAAGTDDVRFFIAGQPVATGTTFNMSSYTASLQLFLQFQKSADANAEGVTIDRISIRGRRS